MDPDRERRGVGQRIARRDRGFHRPVELEGFDAEEFGQPGQAGETDHPTGDQLFDGRQAAFRAVAEFAGDGRPAAEGDRGGKRHFDFPHLQHAAAGETADAGRDQRVFARVRAARELRVARRRDRCRPGAGRNQGSERGERDHGGERSAGLSEVHLDPSWVGVRRRRPLARRPWRRAARAAQTYRRRTRGCRARVSTPAPPPARAPHSPSRLPRARPDSGRGW